MDPVALFGAIGLGLCAAGAGWLAARVFIAASSRHSDDQPSSRKVKR